MGKIIKKDGKIWLEEIQTNDGKHRKMIWLGEYDENEEKPKRKRQKKEG